MERGDAADSQLAPGDEFVVRATSYTRLDTWQPGDARDYEVKSRTQELDPQDWQTLVGTWSLDATHPLLPGETIRGEMTFEWLDGRRLLIQRSSYEHPEIPDAIAIFGVIDDQLSMHYFDSRAVHRIFTVSFIQGTLRYARNAPGFSQRFTLTVSDDLNTIAGRGELSRDGDSWQEDLAITYRRIR